MEYTGIILLQMAGQFPLLVAYVIGMVLAITRWRRHPRVSQLTLIALALLFAQAIVSAVAVIVPPMLATRSGSSAAQVGVVLTGFNIVRTLLVTTATGLLVWAIFGWRSGTVE